MNPLRHVMILASAGSGKTYALTNRFVELLAAGAAPERIVALTFTRKAAGEFFDEILHKLARAARDAESARKLAADIHHSELGSADFLRLLRQMVDAMHRLRLGTLDSFFARVARAFPLELGLTGDFEILQEHAARIERRRVLRQMFARRNGAIDAAQTEFIEAFKRATFGAEEKQLGARLDAFLDQHQENYLAAPEGGAWGDPKRIWTNGSRWLALEIKLADAVAELRRELGELTDGQRGRWEAFFAALAEFTPGAPLPGPVEYILKNALDVWPDVCAGQATMTVDRRKLPLAAGACRALARIITHLVGAEVRRRIETTRGIYAVLRSYESNYHDAVRRAGRLTFADVQRLLAPDAAGVVLGTKGASNKGQVPSAADADPEESGQQLLSLDESAAVEAEERRLLLDYRLDAEIDHWLLDEFQDTSFGQWSILRNLIDEVVQDPEGRRSFFCVGDVKQAIYAWREGDPRLFREIFNHYNSAAPGSIEEQHLVASWRSGPPVIDMVNAIFGRAVTLSELFPGEASATWNREWRAHESAVPQRNGQAALLHAPDEAARWAVTRALLEEIRPAERGLSCAILLKKNDTAAALADYLRAAGIAAVAESDLRIATDNPLGAALLALVQAAAHPGDTFAAEHVRMSPLGAILDGEGLVSRSALSSRVLGQIHIGGFERMAEYWITRLTPRLASDDQFSRRRARELVAAAGLFDATGSRDADEFIAFMERHTIRPPESTSVVRLMTVHKSKGLGFDVVILPDLQGNRIDERREGLAVRKAADRSVDWILDLPPKLFCGQDEVLSAYVRDAEAEACYENLSLLYVALTRAKRAMYVITEPVGKSASRNFPRLLADTLGHESREVYVGEVAFSGAWSSGDSAWHRGLERAEAAPSAPRPSIDVLQSAEAAATHRRASRRASGGSSGTTAAAALFALESAAAAEFGTALHALLAEVEWAAPAGAAAWATTWRDRGEPSQTVNAAVDTLCSAALAAVWRQPADNAEVWRERAFEIVLDGAWVTGVFDRVIVERTADGLASRATVYDFKTDRVASDGDARSAAARYRDQLATYRRVAAVLLALPLEKVAGRIVFTAVNRAVEADGE